MRASPSPDPVGPRPPASEALGPRSVAGPAPDGRPVAKQEVFPEVWSSNSPGGPTYEFKTNCFGDYDALETCFLFTVTRVVVVTPDLASFDLEKDFNVNAYSGEVTRRWVLYGPPGRGLPLPGEYWFLYYTGQDLRLRQTVTYAPEVVDYPRHVTWTKDGNDLVVRWTPPDGAKKGMWYKVLLFPHRGDLISQVFDWDASSARLPSVPLNDGDTGDLNVAIFFRGGFASSANVPVTW